jgi:hypothetical protein
MSGCLGIEWGEGRGKRELKEEGNENVQYYLNCGDTVSYVYITRVRMCVCVKTLNCML